MGHYCRLCGTSRPNEAFSGKGHRAHVCKQCVRLPKEQKAVIEQEDEILGYLRQSHISDKNIERLRALSLSQEICIKEMAALVLEVALVKPYKARRLKVLATERKDLLDRLLDTGG